MKLSQFIKMLSNVKRNYPATDPLILINGKEEFEFMIVTNIRKTTIHNDSSIDIVFDNKTAKEIRINSYE